MTSPYLSSLHAQRIADEASARYDEDELSAENLAERILHKMPLDRIPTLRNEAAQILIQLVEYIPMSVREVIATELLGLADREDYITNAINMEMEP